MVVMLAEELKNFEASVECASTTLWFTRGPIVPPDETCVQSLGVYESKAEPSSTVWLIYLRDISTSK